MSVTVGTGGSVVVNQSITVVRGTWYFLASADLDSPSANPAITWALSSGEYVFIHSQAR